MSATTQTRGVRPGRGLGALSPTGRAAEPAAWALYDFANTIFSYAVVSTAIGLWATDSARFGERDGNLVVSIAVAVSVALNAIVSPILGALSDRGGRRLPFLLFFTACASCRPRSSDRARRSWGSPSSRSPTSAIRPP